MKAWLWFWVVALLVSGPAFAFITCVVTVRGLADLRQMFVSLARQRESSRDR